MDLNKIIFAPSKSRYEQLLERFGSEEVTRKRFCQKIWDDIYEGHHSQKESLRKMREVFPPEKFLNRSQLTLEKISQYDLVISLGGDNHFAYCSQSVLEYNRRKNSKVSIMGVILDQRKSLGALLSCNVDTLLANFSRLLPGDYRIEKWTALEAKVFNGDCGGYSEPYLALGDYFLGEYARPQMSVNEVFLAGKEIFPKKSSGLLVVTGAGTGRGSWYNNIHQVMFKESDLLPKDSRLARIILTEHGSRSKATLEEGRVLTVYSYNDDRGILYPDSHGEHGLELEIGAKAEIKISDIKLNVIYFN